MAVGHDLSQFEFTLNAQPSTKLAPASKARRDLSHA